MNVTHMPCEYAQNPLSTDIPRWAALWIGAPFVGGPRASIPVPYLRKTFTVGGKVIHARLYITALGMYEASINSQRIGDAELAPAGQIIISACTTRFTMSPICCSLAKP